MIRRMGEGEEDEEEEGNQKKGEQERKREKMTPRSEFQEVCDCKQQVTTIRAPGWLAWKSM